MKVLIVDTVSYNRAPYLQYYIDACEEKKVDYDLFLWNRDRTGGLQKDGNIYTMNSICPFGGSKFKKIIPMLRYRNALLKVIKKNQYTHLVLINTLAPVMISSYVLKYYDQKYILDIRDYTYEKIKKYKAIETQLIDHSYFTTVSSRGFLQFVTPSDKIVINHNISNLDKIEDDVTLDKNKKITIGFVGSVRYPEVNQKLITAVQNDPRYILEYVGPEVDGCNLEGFCKEHGIKNVIFKGKFSNGQKPEIYKHIDMINSLYGDFSLEVTTAVPNRYYDALIFKKPIIASKGTYLGELVEENSVGIVVDIKKDNLQKRIENYLDSFNVKGFSYNCNKSLEKCINEQHRFEKNVLRFITE
jgi:glycosyltransferase involved in cell wall biosynthesis